MKSHEQEIQELKKRVAELEQKVGVEEPEQLFEYYNENILREFQAICSYFKQRFGFGENVSYDEDLVDQFTLSVGDLEIFLYISEKDIKHKSELVKIIISYESNELFSAGVSTYNEFLAFSFRFQNKFNSTNQKPLNDNKKKTETEKAT